MDAWLDDNENLARWYVLLLLLLLLLLPLLVLHLIIADLRTGRRRGDVHVVVVDVAVTSC